MNKCEWRGKKSYNSLDRLQESVWFFCTPWLGNKCPYIYKISPILIQFLRAGMDQQKTTFILNHPDWASRSRQTNINSGIFQGNSHSPLLNCIALSPLPFPLTNTTYRYTSGSSTINHLFCMDDLKMYAKNDLLLSSPNSMIQLFETLFNIHFCIILPSHSRKLLY